MSSHLKIVVAVIFFVLTKKETIYGKSAVLKSSTVTEVKLFTGVEQNNQCAPTEILGFKIKRKNKATENVEIHFLFKNINKEHYIKNDFRIKSFRNFKTFHKNNLQCKRGPPLRQIT